ncbi:MAG: DsrE family protein [Desulfovibrionales bacterium]|nr:DsrE family protein [Desulfovibrionales bacterium]
MVQRQSIGWILFIFLCIQCLFIPNAWAGEKKQLFVNLTSADVNRAHMAIEFSAKVMELKQIPVSIFINTEAVKIANMNAPYPRHSNGDSVRKMLKKFIEDGGRVYVCPMCMKNIGHFKKTSLIQGIEIAGKENALEDLFAEGTKVMSY